MRAQAIVWLFSLAASLPAAAQVTGIHVAEMESFDVRLPPLLEKHDIAGLTVAVAKDDRLVFARGYGLADRASGRAVQPDDQFRVASVSKIFTAIAVMHLVETGMLSLESRVFRDLLTDLTPLPGQSADARLDDITVEHLLSHVGGWDRRVSGDYVFMEFTIAYDAGVAIPPDEETMIRWIMGRPLDFDPGTRYAYSNVGYLLMGRIIETVTGRSYRDYVTDLIGPARMRRTTLGRSLAEDRLPYEVTYHSHDGDPLATSVFTREQVPWPYGGFAMETLGPVGGWVSTTVDLVRLALSTDGKPGVPDILEPQTSALMIAVPSNPAAADPDGDPSTDWYHGLGWLVNPWYAAEWVHFHSGSLPGTRSLLAVRSDGVTWAALANGRSPDGSFWSELDNELWYAMADMTAWPTHDLFPMYVGRESAAVEQPATTDIAVFPNPVVSSLSIRIRLPSDAAVRISVVDLLGRTVAGVFDGHLARGSHDLDFDASTLAPGVYGLVLDVGGRRTSTLVSRVR